MKTIGQGRLHVLWPFVICLAFAASIVFLLARQVEDLREIPASIGIKGWHSYPQALLETAGPAPPVYVLWLRPDNLSGFLTYPEFRPIFYTGGTDVDLIDGTLEIAGTSCTYTTVADAALADGARLNFLRRPSCTPLAGTPTGEIKLVVRLSERRRISVGALVPIAPETDQGPASVRIIGTSGTQSQTSPVVRATYVEYLPATGTRRIDLLAYMWQMEPATWMWQFVALACVLLFVGAVVTPRGPTTGSVKRWRFALRAAMGTSAVAAALGVLYVLVTPPFQAPDESHHFLAYAFVTGRPDISEHYQRWSRLIHFNRLPFQPEERFRPIDRFEPWSVTSRARPTGDILSRGHIAWLWLLTARPLGDLPPERVLLALRLLNVLYFAAAMAVAVAATAWVSDLPFPQMTALAFLFVPSLPHFAMCVSNYAILTSGYIVFSAGVLATMFGGRRGAHAGLVLGTGAAVVFLLSRSALPMAAMLSAVVAGRLLIGEVGSAGTQDEVRRSVTFWGGFAGALALAMLLVNPAHQAAVIRAAPEPLANTARLAGRILPLLFIGATLAAIAIEIAFVRVRRRAAARFEQPFTNLAVRMSTVTAAAIAVSMLLSLFVDLPTLGLIDRAHPPEAWRHATVAMLSSLGMFRLRDPDFQLSTTFWAGFGWLDAIPPAWFIVTLTTLTGCALMGLLRHFAKHRSASGIMWLAILFAGWIITVPIYAVAAWRYSINVQGRYLIGLYVTVLPICWSLLMLRGPGDPAALPVSRWTLALAVCLTIHAYAMSVILGRYF